MQRESLLGWWIKVRRRLPAAVCAAVAVLLIAETAFAQRTQRRVIPDCTSPDAEIRIIRSPTKVPVGGSRIVVTSLLCNVGSLFFGSPEALAVNLVDGDDLSRSRFLAADFLGFLLVSADLVGGLPEPHPFFNVIDTNLFCPEVDPVIYGEFADGRRGVSSREGPPPTCVDPIVPTQADLEGRADLLIQVERAGLEGEPEEALYLFPDNVRGNPKAELTVQACCFGTAQLPGLPPSTPLDLIPEEIDRTLSILALDLSDLGILPLPPVYEDTGMPVEETANAQTEVKQDKAPHKEFIKMLERLALAIRVELSNIFGVSATGEPNAQEMVGTVTVAGPFPWVEVTGDLMDDGTFVADGRGTVAGFPDIAVRLEGTLTPGGLVGDYTMGVEGGLPQAEPIIYGVEGRLEEWDTFFDELSAVFLEAAEAAAGVNFEAPLGGVDWGATMQSITGELLRTEAGLLYLDAEGAGTMPGDGLRGVETALTELADAVAGSTLISREQTEANLRQAAMQFGVAAGLMDQVSALARVAPTGTASGDIQRLLDSLQATAPLLDAVRVSALGNSFTTVSAAGYTGPVAPASIVAGFGVTGAADGAAQMIPLPTSLGGVSIRVTDSEGADSPAEFFFSSNLQSNFLIPASAALGDAVLTVFQGDQILATGSVRIEPIAPALFAANIDGMGVAAARFVLVLPDNSQVEDFVFDPNLPVGSRTALPIDLSGEGERVFLVLFGTGIRGFTDEVTATVGGVAVPVPAALAHRDLVGLDQANLGPIPLELIGAGEVEIILVVDGVAANAVTVRFL